MASYKKAMTDDIFQVLLARIQQETDFYKTKMETLYYSKGCFNHQQASTLLHAFKRPEDKIRVIKIMEPRLCRMTCQDAREVLTAFNIQNDRLVALDSVKRVLTDCQTVVGEEYILSVYPFEGDKRIALNILKTVRSDVADKMGSGGHQSYAALGGLFGQARPLNLHMYGPVTEQAKMLPGCGKIQIPPTARTTVIPSIYTGHPSYAYPSDKSYIDAKGFPGTIGYPAKVTGPTHYPGGAPSLGNHSGAPAPTGFPNLDARGFVY